MTTRPSGWISASGQGVGNPPTVSGHTGTRRRSRPRATTASLVLARPSWLHATLRRHADTTRGDAAPRGVGIDITGEFPKPWTDEIVRAADVVVTMGCGDACPLFPGKRYEDWELEDPAGKDIETVRRVRDEIKNRVELLLAEVLPGRD